MRPYRLVESRNWAIDLEHLEHQISARTRAIILISPHNPTGMVAGSQQLNELAGIADRHRLPIISDEVFSEFLFEPGEFPRVAGTESPLVFTLNGFSKMFALPGTKIGWMAVSGIEALVEKAVAALELISDTFLPVNEIAQFAVPEIFRRGEDFLRRYVAWLRQCHRAAMEGLDQLSFVRPQGGFYITIPIPHDEEKAAAALLDKHGLLVHPGYFYDIAPDHLLMTFIDEPSCVRSHFFQFREVFQPR